MTQELLQIETNAADLSELAEDPSDDSMFEPSGATYELPTILDTERLKTTADSFGAVNPFFAHPVGESVYIVEGLLYEQQIGTLAADWNLGKTPLDQQMALCVVAGKPFLGRATTKHTMTAQPLTSGA